MTPAEFLTALWGDPAPGRILVWTLPKKLSLWLTGIPQTLAGQDVLHKALNDRMDQDIYTGVSLAPKYAKLFAHERVTNDGSAAIAGLWADIDIAGEQHKKPNLPPSIEAAQEVLSELNYPASITVHSGHGLQCWWLFDQPWIFGSDHERNLAQQLSQNWHGIVSEAFQRHGWTVDATHDLARVMRLPGTFNHKGAAIQPVKVIETTSFRWQDFPSPTLKRTESPTEGVAPAPAPGKVVYVIGALALSSDLEPPADKLACLMDAVPAFARSWRLQRTDFKGGDQSASVYDQSLASWAAQAGWTDQEIAALLVAHRRETGQDLKLRQDYYQRTIAKARSG
jgi:hypothetical protein